MNEPTSARAGLRDSPLLATSLGILILPLLAECSRCEQQRATNVRAPAQMAAPSASTSALARPAGPVRVEALDATTTPPTFVLRGPRGGDAPIVFLHGMCGHALGYAQSFQHGAARKGFLVAPQGDVACGGPWAKWSGNVDALDRRIVDAFAALGLTGVRDVIVIGYSQGATRAEALARKWPERYTLLVLIGAPGKPAPWGMARVRGAVMMAGERDRQDLMRAGAGSFRAAGIPSTYMVIPEARHGGMGPTPEKTMGEALDWLLSHAKSPSAVDAGLSAE
jgi:pimeloyl-ACP methyl ester carboxylesterase